MDLSHNVNFMNDGIDGKWTQCKMLRCYLLKSTSVDPVNDTLLISMCSDIAAPAVGP